MLLAVPCELFFLAVVLGWCGRIEIRSHSASRGAYVGAGHPCPHPIVDVKRLPCLPWGPKGFGLLTCGVLMLLRAVVIDDWAICMWMAAAGELGIVVRVFSRMDSRAATSQSFLACPSYLATPSLMCARSMALISLQNASYVVWDSLTFSLMMSGRWSRTCHIKFDPVSIPARLASCSSRLANTMWV